MILANKCLNTFLCLSRNVNKMLWPAILQNEVSQHSHLKDRHYCILDERRMGQLSCLTWFWTVLVLRRTLSVMLLGFSEVLAIHIPTYVSSGLITDSRLLRCYAVALCDLCKAYHTLIPEAQEEQLPLIWGATPNTPAHPQFEDRATSWREASIVICTGQQHRFPA